MRRWPALVSLSLFAGLAALVAGSAFSARSAIRTGAPPAVGSATSRLEGMRPWVIMGPAYLDDHFLDGLSLEWDYFMVHDDDWTGIVGYVVADPRHHLGGDVPGSIGERVRFTPSGGNVAIVGEFIASKFRVANFLDFGVINTEVSSTERAFRTVDPETDHFASVEAVPGEGPTGALRLRGRTPIYEWDLMVRQDWEDREFLKHGSDAPFSPVYGEDVGMIPGEFWTVDMIWPRTRVRGRLTRRDTGETFEIDGHGYREDSFGRFNFASDGWDFGIFSSDDSQVQVAWQAYRNGQDHKYLDVSFVENGEIKGIRYRSNRGELGWFHSDWEYAADARQCAAQDTTVVADNGEYRVDVHIEIGERQEPLLSAATFVTDAYVIVEHFPNFSGKITKLATGEVIARFSGQGGGELASPRSVYAGSTSQLCAVWGGLRYSHALPEGVAVSDDS